MGIRQPPAVTGATESFDEELGVLMGSSACEQKSTRMRTAATKHRSLSTGGRGYYLLQGKSLRWKSRRKLLVVVA